MNYDKITEYLDSILEKGIPSYDCIILKNHEVVYRHMNGYSDINKTKPVADNQLYMIFSMTKIQTMVSIMQLEEQGKVSLEDEVSKYLPAYKNLKVKKLINGVEEVVDATSPLTVRKLVSMQSGLDYNLDREGIVRVLKEKGNSATTQEIVNAFVETPLNFEPGEHFCYSLSHDVAAAVVEAVSGMKFSDYLKKNIWEPVGMKNTFFAKGDNSDVERLAQQYLNTDSINPMEQTCNYQLSDAYESGGAGLISCTEDYGLLASTLASGGITKEGIRILKPETVEMFKCNQLSDTGREDIANTMGRLGYGYSYGMQVFMEPEKFNSPAPVGVFGWDGAAGSCTIMDTASKMSLVLMTHVRNCGWMYSEVHPMLRDLLFSD